MANQKYVDFSEVPENVRGAIDSNSSLVTIKVYKFKGLNLKHLESERGHNVENSSKYFSHLANEYDNGRYKINIYLCSRKVCTGEFVISGNENG